MMLRQAADEAIVSGADSKSEAGIRRVRLAQKDALRFKRRLLRLYADYEAAADPEGELYVLSTALFRVDDDTPTWRARCVASGRRAASGGTATS